MWDADTYFMVLRREFFATFTTKSVADAHTTAQVLIAFSRASRDAVDDIFSAGLSAGGSESRATEDLGFMYTRALDDPDGNILEFFYMDEAAAELGPQAFQDA